MEQNIKISQLPASETLDGFSALGVSADNATVKVDMSFVQQAADNANTATTNAVAATEDAIAATTAATEATALTESATEAAVTATTAANTAAQSANEAKEAATAAAASANTAATLAAENAELAGTNASRADQSATRATAAAVGVEEAIANTEAATDTALEAAATIDTKVATKADLIYVDQQLATKAAAMDYSSLEEQIVPGEFWLGTDGLRRQVFIRTFIGSVYNLPINQKIIIATGILHGYAVSGYIETTMKDNSRITTPMDFKNYTINYSTDTRDKSLGLYNLDMTYNDYKEVKYNLTFKYTKL